MNVTKRKTKFKCEACNDIVIGYKLPPVIQGTSCTIEFNEEFAGTKDTDIGFGKGTYHVCRKCIVGGEENA